ncbi:MAG: tryptophan 7-halogenase [Chloroflexota bacterium]
MQTDIAIIGGGIAAAAALISLRDSQRSITVIAPPPTTGEIIGESLSPSANPLLKELGLWKTFQQEGYSPAVTNFSSWGTNQLIQRDFRQNPSGSGWTVDRQRFEAFLWHRAERTTHRRFLTQLQNFEKAGDGWHLTTHDGTEVDARFVLDCSGRSAVVARHLTERHRDATMVAASAFLPHTDPEVEPTEAVMIEARHEGWWYTTITPSGRLVVCFFSDPDLVPSNLQQDTPVWQALAQSAIYTWQRIETAGFSIVEPPRLSDAGTLFSADFAGTGWAAVGDAAASLDPLSAHGMTTALWSGRKAGLAAHAALDGDNYPMQQYVADFEEGIIHYRQELKQFYRQERRFPGASFWQRRQNK